MAFWDWFKPNIKYGKSLFPMVEFIGKKDILFSVWLKPNKKIVCKSFRKRLNKNHFFLSFYFNRFKNCFFGLKKKKNQLVCF